MEEFIVYVLYSNKYYKTYVGFTTNLIARFKSHNELATKGYTIKFRPWQVLHTEIFNSKKEALAREKYFKTGAGREHISQLIEKLGGSYPPQAD